MSRSLIVAREAAVQSLQAEGWDLGPIVRQLREAGRSLSAGTSPTGRRELPSHDALVAIARGLRSALFPAHFGPSDLSEEGIDYFVGHTLDATLLALLEQVRRALTFAEHAPPRPSHAAEIVREFASRLPKVRALLESDVHAAFDGDPAATSIDEAVFCYPGIAAITLHRLAHELYRLAVPLIPRILSEISHVDTGVDIHPAAAIGGSFFIDHGTGVVVGETTRIGERVRLYQGVTLGAKSFPLDDDGFPTKGIARHPIVEDDVVIYAGATVLGRIRIGAGSSIGGNVWLTRSVPPHSQVTQAQARSEAFEGGGGI
ncbi:MAG TPA: serine O-acetyltransferase EpsC [Polyangiaceae bacterium]|nr:serine O-acetyltransferase EpsC [Polyangiaceae bacterium]